MNIFMTGDSDEIRVKFYNITIKTNTDSSVILAIRKTKEFTGNISSLCIFENIWSSFSDEKYFSS